MAKQRLRASQTILNGFHEQHAEIQKQLIRLAREELDDALAVLTSNFTPQPFYPVSVDRINLAKNEIAAALAAANSGGARGRCRTRSRGSRTRAISSARTSPSSSDRGT